MILGVLIPLSIGMGLIGLIVFFWAMRHGQFEDLDGAAWRIIPPANAGRDFDAPLPVPAPSRQETPAMTITKDAQGNWIVDAATIAPAFQLAPAEVPALMRDGQITSRHEKGEDENAGRSRLTFFYGSRAFRLTIDEAGQILSRASFEVAPRNGADG